MRAEAAATPLIVHRARKLDADGLVDDFWLETDGTRIVRTGTGDGWRRPDPPSAAGDRLPAASRSGAASSGDGGHQDGERETVDARGHWLTPGFIDLHGHGGGGFAFDDGPAAAEAALAVHRGHGTTRSVLSLVARPVAELTESLRTIAALTDRDPLVLGAHLEGPFLSPRRRGAHDPAFLLEPDPALVEKLIGASAGTLRQITMAPELTGALEAIPIFTEAGVTVAVGHTEADYATASRAFRLGARLLTHAFNAMPGISGRLPGPVVAAVDHDRAVLELILDGFHVDPRVANLLFRLAGGRVALITDAMAAAGSADGDYRLGELEVTVTDGHALLSGTETIAGSTLTQDAALRVAVTAAGLPPQRAVEALTLTPARALGLDRTLGLLKPGYAADAVLLDHRWTVRRVWANGRGVTRTPEA